MNKFEEEFNYLIELSGKVLTGQIEAEVFETHRAIFLNKYAEKQQPEDHQAEIEKTEIQNLKYREEIARMQNSLRKKNKAIKELNGAVKKNKARLKECEDLRIEANNQAAMEYSRKCEVVEDRAELKREIEKLKSQIEKQQPDIPEVPQFMDDWLKSLPLYELIDCWYSNTDRLPDDVIDYLDNIAIENQDNYDDSYEEITTFIAKAKINGYTVAKPKIIVTPCPVCGFEDVENNFCGMCGHKNDYVTADEVEEKHG